MNVKIIAIVVIFIDNFRLCQSKTYDNYSLYSVTPRTKEQLEFIVSLERLKYVDIIFWTRPMKLFESVQLIVSPIDNNLFLERAENVKLKAQLLNKNVQSAFDDQTVRKYFRLRVNSFAWNTYHTLEDIYQWLIELSVNFGNIIKLVPIGKSTEGREIFDVVVKYGHPKYKVIVEGGIHGHEWIAIEFVIYLLDQLLRSINSNNQQLKPLVVKYEWHLIPIVNPDGFLYSQTSDRLWRKNRRELGGNNYGVDLDRNFDYKFGKFGTSDEENNAYYCGVNPFSEPESQALINFVQKNSIGTKFYFAFHAYGQKIVIPYADKIRLVDNSGETEHIAGQAANAIHKAHKVKYGVENVLDSSYGLRYSGNSASYIKVKYNIRYVYIFHLGDNGTYGYALPPSKIEPTCQEAQTGVVELMTAPPGRKKLVTSSGHVLFHRSIFLLIFIVFVCTKL